MSKKEEFFKERFKQALDSTYKVISGEFDDLSKKENQKDIEDYKISNLYSREDYIKFRAFTDSNALKKKFSDKNIFKKNFPKNQSYKIFYETTEKIRCELLGSYMLNGIKKNIYENYYNKILNKKESNIKKREDVNVSEAFELYLLKNFLDIKLNNVTNKILGFWEDKFDKNIKKHTQFLKKNITDQNKYNEKISEKLSLKNKYSKTKFKKIYSINDKRINERKINLLIDYLNKKIETFDNKKLFNLIKKFI